MTNPKHLKDMQQQAAFRYELTLTLEVDANDCMEAVQKFTELLMDQMGREQFILAAADEMVITGPGKGDVPRVVVGRVRAEVGKN